MIDTVAIFIFYTNINMTDLIVFIHSSLIKENSLWNSKGNIILLFHQPPSLSLCTSCTTR